MSKVIAGTAFVLLGGATAAGGVLLSRNSGQGQNADVKEQQENQPNIELPTTLTDLGKQAHTKGCVPTLLTGLTDVSTITEAVSSGDISATFLTATDKKKETNGCLVVNWDRKSKKSESNALEKWSGTFRLLWAAKGETKGFLVLLVGTTTKENSSKSIKWEGAAYTLAKENEAWKAKKKQAVGTGKTFTKSTSDDGQFPQPGEVLGNIKDKTFWGFMASKDDVEKVDTGDDLTEDGKYRGHWTWVGSDGTGDKALDGWTKELNKWWEAIFTKTNWDMTQVIKDSKATWTLKSETPPSTTGK